MKKDRPYAKGLAHPEIRQLLEEHVVTSQIYSGEEGRITLHAHAGNRVVFYECQWRLEPGWSQPWIAQTLDEAIRSLSRKPDGN